ncbi:MULTISPECIES: ISH3 family transposase [Methanosarcina]|uniref:Mobile element protein n=1 Tax=Methanosarcina vacuolata Z-761 TaxID=1434123 RepID=A0A0E3LHI6_9EURY|nr:MULTISPECIES: ISH3 family transposase [Methanosarcina]AKB44260.1 Mobile element protein [Methanosarcina vacuolata Z-761]AKB44336.1 Mobile element protein [Methanosarcina vacuolata Z-761]AKB48357.1 Mobile element protein [Methanosarcina sp. Kolksee]
MPTKNDSMTTDTASLLAVSSELISKYNIITLPESANYECQDTLNILLHAATSSTDSLESASNDLQRKNPDLRIPSADTIFNYIKENKIEDILSSFRKMNLELFKMMKLENNIHDIAIDFHDISYYGDKNTPGIRGIKLKNGSSWGKSFCTLDIIGTSHLTLDVIDINSLNKNYSLLIESLFKRLKTIGVKTGTTYLDKEFFNTDVISKLDELKVNFVIAAKSTQVINRELKNHQKEYGNTSTIFEYRFQKGGPSFNVVAIYNNKKKKYLLFATNKKAESIEKFEKMIPEEYRKRWNIETGYRVKNEFKIRSCTKSPVARVLFFIIQCIMYNVLNMLKSVLEITAYELKSLINEDIKKVVRYGLRSLNFIPVSVLLDCLRWVNEERNRVLRTRLTII